MNRNLGMRGNWKKAIAGLSFVAISLAALTPSIAMNLANAMNGGSQSALLVLAVMSVVTAPLCLLAIPALTNQRRYDLLMGAAILFALSLAFNLTNAAGLVGGARDGMREDAKARMTKVGRAQERLSQVKLDLDRQRSNSGNATPEMAEAELFGLRADPVFKRSAECTSVTLPDSKALCQKIADMLARKSTVEQVQKLETERADLTAKLTQWGAAPATVDPKVDRITSLLGLLIDVSQDGQRWIGISLDLGTATLVELMAAFLPAIAAAALLGDGPARETQRTTAREIIREVYPVNKTGHGGKVAKYSRNTSGGLDDRMIAEERILLFATERLRPGGETLGADVNEAVQGWWGGRYPGTPAPSRNVVAKVLTEAGIDKVKRGGKIRYAAALVS